MKKEDLKVGIILKNTFTGYKYRITAIGEEGYLVKNIANKCCEEHLLFNEINHLIITKTKYQWAYRYTKDERWRISNYYETENDAFVNLNHDNTVELKRLDFTMVEE